jgi:mannose/cellobiose epimerase-like protein (N-acyl-D-glucosamine 2-epimerase family)
MPNDLSFTLSDTISGYVSAFDPGAKVFTLRTTDGREFAVDLDDSTSGEVVRNLQQPYANASNHLYDMLQPGRFVSVYGVFYPESGGTRYTAKRIIFFGRGTSDYAFEQPGWWTTQIDRIARFYRQAQFGGAEPDYRDYRTLLRLGGEKEPSHLQETDTISRLVYGMASAYMLTGNDDFLDVAEAGTEYLREHMRFVDNDNDVIYWYHGIQIDGQTEKKIFTSEFDDDYDAIPMYEQIYALAGPTQTFRVSGDPRIAADIDGTLRLFEKYFRDHEGGGYYSHIDPILLSPDHDSLGANKARKNWNSVGDHAPAYLINLYLATGEQRHAEMLERTFDTIVEHFPDYDNSPFVQERFFADWSHDETHTWQQNRAVVGHNLKIAWNLMRMHALNPKQSYQDLATKIGDLMPSVGMDTQRGGWYDVVERIRGDQRFHRFAWHDRKAWWQQEQAILAYLILAGSLDANGEYRREAREAEAFYNAYFLDHDEGAVYFNVLANGIPYLLGTERLKGSHSMSMYHSTELCYLSAVYNNLLLTGQPLTLWFKPLPGASRLLRVAPDLLPPGRARIIEAEVDGKPYEVFDPEAMTVELPQSSERLTVRVTLSAAGG